MHEPDPFDFSSNDDNVDIDFSSLSQDETPGDAAETAQPVPPSSIVDAGQNSTEKQSPTEKQSQTGLPKLSETQKPAQGNTESADEKPVVQSVKDYLLFSLSLPERALRTTAGIAGGAVRESAALLVPQAFQDSTTYSVLVKETLNFLTEDIGGVKTPKETSDDKKPQMENFVARKTVGNFVEMAGLATLHVSPVMLLAVVSDIAYGSQSCLKEIANNLKEEGIIDTDSTIDSTSDFLEAIGNASGKTASSFNAPPISIAGLQEMVQQTKDAISVIDPTKVLPKAEAARMWEEMQEISNREGISMLEISSALSLNTLDRVAHFTRGALSSTRSIGRLFDRHVIDHYRTALSELHEKGFYSMVAESSGPYIEAVWTNFSTDKSTITQDLLNGKIAGNVAKKLTGWLGLQQDDNGVE